MTSPVSLPAGKEILAADLDAYENLTGPWIDFTNSLAWTAVTANPVLGNGVRNARYMQAGKFVVYTGRIMMGSTTTFGTGQWRVNLPVAASSASLHVATAFVNDASTAANRKPAVANLSNASLLQFFGDTGPIDANNPFVWAVSDELYWSFMYEAA